MKALNYIAVMVWTVVGIGMQCRLFGHNAYQSGVCR